MPKALTIGEMLSILIMTGDFKSLYNYYERVYIPDTHLYPLPYVEDHLLDTFESLRTSGFVEVLSFHDEFTKLQADYMQFMAEDVEKAKEEVSFADQWRESYLAPLFEPANRLEADLLLPPRSPFTDIREELKKLGLVSHAKG